MERIIGFIQPKRRSTRQRSGFKVSGTKTGSECIIDKTQRFEIEKGDFIFSKVFKNIEIVKLFGENIGIFGTGGYFKSNDDCLLELIIEHKNNTVVEQITKKNIKLTANHWIKFGDEIVFNNPKNNFADIVVTFKLVNTKNTVVFEVFDFVAGIIDYYTDKNNYLKPFFEKTEIYRPDIYYLSVTDFKIQSNNYSELEPGYIATKSCNRCARFLPIDVNNELNCLGFSNHCKKRAPCKHKAFSRFKIENVEIIKNLPDSIKDKIIKSGDNYFIQTHYGYQLECRSCKKFVVNAPLNPLRNKSQHHEDGARRRAIERLMIDITGEDVVKQFRIKKGIEFQDYIWNNFSKKCFGCGKELLKITDMDIDHTMPLVYLWPLDETATALCKTCNSQKHDLFPFEFKKYGDDKLIELSKLTGIPERTLFLKERKVNERIAKILVNKVEWFFDDFLSRKDYQKIKKGKKVSDLIFKAINKVLATINIDLVSEYKLKTKRLPKSITLG